MKAKVFAFVLLAVLLALVTTPVYADDAPVLPHAFYGMVDINGSPAPVGTSVEVRGEGVTTVVGTNPIEVTVEGEYGGGTDPLEPKLVVQGSIAEGATVTFYVNGVSTGQTAQWYSGEVTEIDLAATIDESSTTTTTSSSSDTSDSTSSGTTDSSSTTTDDSTAVTTDTTDSTSSESAEPASPESTEPAPLLPPSAPSGSSEGVPVLWLVVGGAVLVGLIITFLVARSRAY